MLNNLILIILGMLLFMHSSAEAYALKDVEIEKHKYYDNLYINTTDYARPKVQMLADPPRLVVDFKGGAFAKSFKAGSIKSTRIKGLRLGDARVVIDLARSVDYEVASLMGKNQVFIEIREKPGVKPTKVTTNYKPQTAKASKSKPKPKPKAKPVVEVKSDVPKSGLIAALDKKPSKARSSSTKKVSQRSYSRGGSVLKGKVIVIDPGHGGGDPGASANGLVEKNMTLKTALELAKFLKKAGARVYLTRDSDKKVNLRNVASFANRRGAHVFVSIHYNYIDNRNKKGTETYYYNSRSQKLAQSVHRNMVKGIHRKDRGVRRAKFYVIHHTKMPSVLVEPLFISNRSDAAFAKSSGFYRKVAWDITAGLKEYFK